MMPMQIDKNELIGIIILSLGLVFLILTFYMAFLFLIQELTIITQPDLVKSLGKILGPIAEAIIRIMFLAIMGWIGSLTTLRGMQFLRIRKSPEVKHTQPPAIHTPPAIKEPKPRKESSQEA
jgi:hypothetical protein